MIKSSFVDLLKLRLGSREDSDMDALIAAEAVQVQTELEQGQFQPWFLYDEDATLATVSGNRSVSLPSDFLSFQEEDDDAAVTYITDEGIYQPLLREDRAKLENYYGEDSNAPTHFVPLPTSLLIYPKPDAVYTIRILGFFADESFADLTDAEENKWLKHAGDWLLAKTGARIARYIKDKDAAVAFAVDEKEAYARVYTRHTMWLGALQNRILGGL